MTLACVIYLLGLFNTVCIAVSCRTPVFTLTYVLFKSSKCTQFHFLCCYFFVSLLHFHIWWLISSHYFCSMLSGFTPRRQGGATTTCFAVCKWAELAYAQWPITNTLWKKWWDWSLILISFSYLRCDLRTEELAAKLIIYTVSTPCCYGLNCYRQNSYAGVLIRSTLERDYIWRWVLWRG